MAVAGDPFPRTVPGPSTYSLCDCGQAACPQAPPPQNGKSHSCCCSVGQSCLTLRPLGIQHPRLPCPSPSPKLTSMELVMPSNHLVLCHPLLPLPSICPSIRVFPSELALCIRWPKYQSLSFLLGFQAYYKVITSLLSLPSRCVPNL